MQYGRRKKILSVLSASNSNKLIDTAHAKLPSLISQADTQITRVYVLYVRDGFIRNPRQITTRNVFKKDKRRRIKKRRKYNTS